MMHRVARTVGLVALTVAVTPGVVGRAAVSPANVPAKPDDKTIVHVLNRLGFGPAPGDLDRVRSMGLQSYIERQLNPERIEDTKIKERLAPLETLSKSTRDLAEEYYLPAQMARRERQQQQGASAEPMTPEQARASMTPEQANAVQGERRALGEIMQAKILRAAYSERQLEEVMVDFWFNHFNVFSGKGQVRIYLNEYERDAIRPHVLGKFKDLLSATAHSPAMLFYLDNWQSAAPDGAITTAERDRANERARNDAMRPVRPGQPRLGTMARQPLPNAPRPQGQNRRRGLNENYARELMELHTLGVDGGYTQKDVQEVARAFSGWTVATPREGGPFRFEPRMHDDGEKVVLGRRIPAGGGEKDGNDVIALLAKHPSTATFIATKLARRFVADNPPKTLVDRAAQRFRDTDGDIREVVRTIVTSAEFFAADALRAKVKTPFEFVVSAVRATGIELNDGQAAVMAVRNLGMPLYGCQPPTGYADKAEAWVNSGALLNRMNFAVQLTSGRGRAGGRAGQGRMAPPSGAGTPPISTASVIASTFAGELSESTAATVAKATTTPQALALVLGSPEFQRR